MLRTVRIRRVSIPVFLAALLPLAACQQAPVHEAEAPRAPTTAAGVAAANPYAVEAGLEILRAGGSAVDAAVAVQAMLGLVEPQSSGIGGGAFLMYYDAADRPDHGLRRPRSRTRRRDARHVLEGQR